MRFEQLESRVRRARRHRSRSLHARWWRALARVRNGHLAARACDDVPREGITVARPCGA